MRICSLRTFLKKKYVFAHFILFFFKSTYLLTSYFFLKKSTYLLTSYFFLKSMYLLTSYFFFKSTYLLTSYFFLFKVRICSLHTFLKKKYVFAHFVLDPQVSHITALEMIKILVQVETLFKKTVHVICQTADISSRTVSWLAVSREPTLCWHSEELADVARKELLNALLQFECQQSPTQALVR